MLSSPSRSQVRIIDVSPDSPEIDIYQNSAPIAHKLAFGTITSYVPVDPGAYKTTATVAGTRQTLASSKATLAKAGQYTVLIGDSSSNLQQRVLKDQSQPAPPGQIALRFIDEATRSGPVDIYLVPAGQKLTSEAHAVAKAAFGDNIGYVNVPAGTYTLMMTSAGDIPEHDADALYSGAQISYAAGTASTVILIDQQTRAQEPGLQVIVAPDYVPPEVD